MKYYEVDKTKDVWACAFDVDTDRGMGSIIRLIQAPILGQIIHGTFYAYKKNKDAGFQKNGVNESARQYSYTYEECVSIYNGLITKKIEKLRAAITNLEGMKIRR